MPPGFEDRPLLTGLSRPTSVRFLPGGAVLITEQRGAVKWYPGPERDEPHLLLDLRSEVYSRGQLGMLGMAVDPGWPVEPYLYLAYTRDAPLGGVAPAYGIADADEDDCPERSACPASARVSRFQLDDGSPPTVRAEQVLLEDWCVSGPNHTIGTLAFGPDGALYAGGGDGADGANTDYGQLSRPPNACADPPANGEVPAPPLAEGGALRSQDLRTRGDPVALNGTIARVSPTSGEPLPDNPLAGDRDANARRIVAYGLRNPFRFTFRPGTGELWVADVGWDHYEEINRIVDPLAGPPPNLGWPCFEGPFRQPVYESLGLRVCADLYASEPPELLFPLMSFARGDARREACDSPSAATSALVFYQGEAFPDEYAGALFFADLPRRCIFVIHAGPDGLPDHRTVRQFARRVSPVDMIVGPDGALYYLDIVEGSLRRIGYRPPG